MSTALRILMVAAENDGIRTPKGLEAKVGGIGDVVRDTPPALAALGDPECRVTVLVPSYGFLHTLEGAQQRGAFDFAFAGSREEVQLLEVPGRRPDPKVRHLVLHSPRFVSRHPVSQKLSIYCDDPPDAPFATDATKFACFCAAVAEGLRRRSFGEINRLHLHDWHAAFLLVLRELDPQLAELKRLRTVYTIHNLSLQGIRPVADADGSSLEAWYPHLPLSPASRQLFLDPDYRDCLNPMAVGIRLSDAVHTVSPGYKLEIQRSTIPRRFDAHAERFGGEGLEADLVQADREGRLHGILNGCEYDNRTQSTRDEGSFQELLRLLIETVSAWAGKAEKPVHVLALERLKGLQQSGHRPRAVLTCVTRAVNQKIRLMLTPDDRPALGEILPKLSDDALVVLLGTGELDAALLNLSARHANFVFFNGYDNACANSLYAHGDLFLMPSSFEPCGISQMLAMRDGQPCVVHHVGGLKDTVRDNETGFAFTGDNAREQAQNFVKRTLAAVSLLQNDLRRYDLIRQAAFKARFLWSDSVREYARMLYR